MSTFLLLRNNKETGPFTIEEIKDLPLKAFDLLWVVGKSAAWRYPGEIPELKAFAPAVPEQPADLISKKTNVVNAPAEITGNKKTESVQLKSRDHKTTSPPSRSVYVNLPAEKKQPGIPASRAIYDVSLQTDPEPHYDFSELYHNKPTRAVRVTGKLLWICSILLLFGTGILTGFFISDRRKFFSSDANNPHLRPTVPTAGFTKDKGISTMQSSIATDAPGKGDKTNADVPGKTDAIVPGKSHNAAGKRNLKNASLKKDSLIMPVVSSIPVLADSSLHQKTAGNTELLYQQVKAHPENYVNMVMGKYTTGIFGGISSIPVTVTNNSPVMMDQVIVTISYIQSNNKVFKTEKIAFNDLEPGETVMEKAPKSPRGTKISARIHSINSHKLELNYSN